MGMFDDEADLLRDKRGPGTQRGANLLEQAREIAVDLDSRIAGQPHLAGRFEIARKELVVTIRRKGTGNETSIGCMGSGAFLITGDGIHSGVSDAKMMRQYVVEWLERFAA